MNKTSIFVAVLSYVLILVIVPLLFYRDDEYVSCHAKQGIVLLLLWAAVPFVLAIPLIGWILGALLILFDLILTVFGIVQALKGEEKPLPLVGKKIEHIIF